MRDNCECTLSCGAGRLSTGPSPTGCTCSCWVVRTLGRKTGRQDETGRSTTVAQMPRRGSRQSMGTCGRSKTSVAAAADKRLLEPLLTRVRALYRACAGRADRGGCVYSDFVVEHSVSQTFRQFFAANERRNALRIKCSPLRQSVPRVCVCVCMRGSSPIHGHADILVRPRVVASLIVARGGQVGGVLQGRPV